jgi:DnaJ-class molecular chaperone
MDKNEEQEFEPCPSCLGAGIYSVGYCEDGYWEICPECDGLGEKP